MTTTVALPTDPESIARHNMFTDPTVNMFDLLAAQVGRDKAGVLFIQACLAYDQLGIGA